MTSGSGNCNICNCGDKSRKWEVCVSRHVDGAMYVLTQNDNPYDFCVSISIPIQRQIRSLPTIQGTIRGDRNMKRKTLVSLVQVSDHASFKTRRLKLYKEKDDVVDMIDGEWNASFTKFHYLLGKLREIDPGTTVRLEVDQRLRFLRCFLDFGVTMSIQPNLIPLLGFDGTHSRHPKYNGVALSIICRDGNGQISLLLRC